jgi:hypothetical protein
MANPWGFGFRRPPELPFPGGTLSPQPPLPGRRSALRPGPMVLLLALGALALAGPTRGQEAKDAQSTPAVQDAPDDPREAKPERPTIATHAFAVAPGIVELETGGQFQYPVHGVSLFSEATLLKIGLVPRLQLDIAPGYLRASSGGETQDGLPDLQVGLKWQVAQHAPLLGAFALQALAKLPTGSFAKGTGTDTTDLNLLAISSHSFGPVDVDVNLGYTRRSGNGEKAPKSVTLWTCAAGFPLHGRLGWTGEVFGYAGTSGFSGTPAIVAFLTGPTLTVRKQLVLDAGAVFSLENYGGTAAYAGLTWNVGRLWTPQAELPKR